MKKIKDLEYLPGCCKLCSRASSHIYIDMETVDDFHGHVYYCFECVREMSNLLGFVTPDQLVEIKEDHEEEIEELRERVKRGSVLDWLADHSVDLSRFIAWLESEEVSVSSPGTRRAKQEAIPGFAESSDESGLRNVPVSF